ncbi:DUF3311 domain-containing protein [Alicyclobacillus ferrooxydans]|uniref:DUF3311 domain-containing protein n=1 Tax=Alicyclobacillus ferrooxydans TaxID=471514 RepID=A0A0P9CI51_9BACL|nr:DUF3311 domain-containing protein [Alicyclobacillus ferrooxydans]KPV42724.1 hypothetical protein AN477_16155 [Alicyclobacillus ferrooxydans]
MRTLLLIIMLIGNILAVPFVNSIHPLVLGMPFFLFWLLIWMIITPLLTWWIYAMDQARE